MEEYVTLHSSFEPVSDVSCILPFKKIFEISVKEKYVPFHSSFEPVSDVGCW